MTAGVVGRAGPPSAIELFGAALLGQRCELVGLERTPVALPTRTWAAAVTASDRAVLAHCRGATLDVGCGPGRMSVHLAEQGHEVAGIDVVPEAVAEARRRGVPAWCGDVFDPMPGEGRWDTVLLADGNIGIEGRPAALLRRVAALLGPGGRVVADLAPYGAGVRQRVLRLRAGARVSTPFPWTIVGADAIGAIAERAGLRVLERHEYAGRWCAVLEAAP